MKTTFPIIITALLMQTASLVTAAEPASALQRKKLTAAEMQEQRGGRWANKSSSLPGIRKSSGSWVSRIFSW